MPFEDQRFEGGNVESRYRSECDGSSADADRGIFKPGAVVIDAGISYDEEGKLCGDVDFEAVVEKVGAISPVPGGVGAITNAILMEHVFDIYRLFYEDGYDEDEDEYEV